MRRQQVGKWLAAVIVAPASSGRNPARAQGAPTLAQVIQGLERTERLFFASESFLIRYERSRSEDLTATTVTGGYLLAEWTLAYKGNKWLTTRRFTKPERTEEYVVPEELRVQVLRDRVLLEWDQYTRSALLDPFENGRNIFQDWLYTRNLSLDAPKQVAASGGADTASLRQLSGLKDDLDLPFLPEFLRANQSRYHVRPEPEEVDGARCWVVEWPGVDRFWVDPLRGFAVPRRVYAYGPGKPLNFEFLQRDYHQVKPGLWLPFTQIENKYSSFVESEALWGQVACRSEYRVHQIEFDRLPDRFFDVKLPPGTRVLDSVRKLEYLLLRSAAAPFVDPIAAAARERNRGPGWRVLTGPARFVMAPVAAFYRWLRRLGG
jgi:hypothetical protein